MDILLIDDDNESRGLLGRFLTRMGHTVVQCRDGQEGLEAFQSGSYPLVLSDVLMPRMTGIDFLQAVSSDPRRRDSSIVIMTANANIQTAISALRLGAYDYLTKPINLEELAALIGRVVEFHSLRREHTYLKDNFSAELKAATHQTLQEIERLKSLVSSVGGMKMGVYSESMRQVVTAARKYHTDRSIPVLIEGETGTGKEVIARIIHHGEGLNPAPFVDINCAALSANLFESELFGYEQGAFTGGLNKGQKGKFDLAAGGTLFLDEIGEIPLELQGKLLRVLEEREFYRVGGLKKIKTDVRVICATNVGVAQKVEAGAFRRDLFYRLKVGHIEIPPLRERREEVAPLVHMFLEEFSAQKKKRFKRIGRQAEKLLETYTWPGNVRELRNAVDWATFMHDGEELLPEHLGILSPRQPVMGEKKKPVSEPVGPAAEESKWLSLDDYIDRHVLVALEKCGGNKTEAAKLLQISRRALCYRLDNIGQRQL